MMSGGSRAERALERMWWRVGRRVGPEGIPCGGGRKLEDCASIIRRILWV